MKSIKKTRLWRRLLDIAIPPERMSVKTVRQGPLKGYSLKIQDRFEVALINGTHEPDVQNAIRGLLKKGMIAYDVGAHIGYFSLLMSGLCREVYSFEPNPVSYRRIYDNIGLNNIPNIKPRKYGISDQVGYANLLTRELHYRHPEHFKELADIVDVDAKPIGKRFGASTARIVKERSNDTVRIRTTTLDSFALDGHNPLPGFIKIDVEGYEGKVLRGARHLLEKKKPIILCEIHGSGPAKRVWRILKGNGYEITAVEKDITPKEDMCRGHIVGMPG